MTVTTMSSTLVCVLAARAFCLLTGCATIGLFPNLAVSAWIANGTPVCLFAGTQSWCQVAPDGSGGAFIVWEDRRVDPEGDLYLQRITSEGVIHASWQQGGHVLCDAAGRQFYHELVSDGDGGIYVAWIDGRSGPTDVYAQRILEDGTIAWTDHPQGLPVCTAPGIQTLPSLALDAVGGLFVSWTDNGGFDVFVQRITASGEIALGWPINGMVVCDAPGQQGGTLLVSDENGGAHVVWQDNRTNVAWLSGYSSHVTGDPVPDPLWPEDGRQITGGQSHLTAFSDVLGGVIVLWNDVPISRDDPVDLYAKRFGIDGATHPSWPAAGLKVCENCSFPEAVADGSGGGYIVWPAGTQIAQHVTSSGTIASGWPPNGIALPETPGHNSRFSLVSNGAGGAVVVYDSINGTTSDVFAYHLTPDGTPDPGWPGGALMICENTGSYPAIAMVDSKHAIAAWHDNRGPDGDIYAQRIGFNGGNVSVGGENGPALATLVVAPTPFRAITTISLALSRSAAVHVTVRDLQGRLRREMVKAVLAEGQHRYRWDGYDDSGSIVSPGLYFIQLVTPSGSVSMKVVRVDR